MNNEHRFLELIDTYLRGDLSDPEMEEVQRLRATDPDFDALFNDMKTISDAVTLHQLEDKYAMLKQYENANPLSLADSRGIQYRQFLWIAAIAAGIILVTFGRWLFMTTEPDRDQFAVAPILAVFPFENTVTDSVTRALYAELDLGIPRRLETTRTVRPVTYLSVQSAIHTQDSQTMRALLGTDYYLEGSVVEGTNRALELNARLTHSERNETVWDTTVQVGKGLEAYLNAEHLLAESAKTRLAQLKPSSPEGAAQPIVITENTPAHLLYVEADKVFQRRDSLEKAVSMLLKAHALDRQSAMIKAKLALVYSTIGESASADPANPARNQAFVAAKRFAEEALETDANAAEAYLALADISETQDYDYDQAFQLLQKAKAIRPHNADVHRALAEVCIKLGEIRTGDAHIQMARDLDPASVAVRWQETKYLIALGLYDDAMAAAAEIDVLFPGNRKNATFDWNYYMALREYDMAFAAIPVDYPAEYRPYMEGLVYLEKGELEKLEGLLTNPAIEAAFRPLILIRQGDISAAAEMIDAQLENHNFFWRSHMQVLPIPVFHQLKAEPRISSVFRRRGIKLYAFPKPKRPTEI